MVDKSLEIRAVKFTTSEIDDATMPPELLDQITPCAEISTVTANGAFNTPKCQDVIVTRGAAAIIPPCTNAKFWWTTTSGAIARNQIMRTSKRVARTIWRP